MYDYNESSMNSTQRYDEALELLMDLVRTPSFSTEEHDTAMLLSQWLQTKGIDVSWKGNNIWARNRHFSDAKPTILLNSHHDTVRPNKNYTRDPFVPEIENGKLYGLGSNDAGGCLVSLMSAFAHFYGRDDMAYNLVLAASAEEEISGDGGLRSILLDLPPIGFAIVGEPTGMDLAISERGLLVIDGYANGVAGHAAHDNTLNAIYEAMQDIEWIRNHRFSADSEAPVKMTVTQVNAGSQHNVVPGECHFVVDVRLDSTYTTKEVFNVIDEHTSSELVARSFKHNPSSIEINHPIVRSGIALGRKTFHSGTLSDQTVLSCPSLKMGPGQTSRSHTADEYIELQELKDGIDLYIRLLDNIL